MYKNIILVIFLFLTLSSCATKEDVATPEIRPKDMYHYEWHGVQEPTENKAQSYGGYTRGCVDGAIRLPNEGKGYKVVDMLNNRQHGHPDLIKMLEKLGEKADEIGETIMIGDLGHPRGGPASIQTSAHRSHQSGLDVDIWFRTAPDGYKLKQALYPTSVLNKKRDGLSSKGWHEYNYKILKVIAGFDEVERVLVNPLVKKAMCERYDNAKWLNKFRPWWGHDKHFHVRLACPKGGKYCSHQSPVPNDHGCGEELAWWFSDDAKQEGKKKKAQKRVYPKLPAQCNDVFEWEG